MDHLSQQTPWLTILIDECGGKFSLDKTDLLETYLSFSHDSQTTPSIITLIGSTQKSRLISDILSLDSSGSLNGNHVNVPFNRISTRCASSFSSILEVNLHQLKLGKSPALLLADVTRLDRQTEPTPPVSAVTMDTPIHRSTLPIHRFNSTGTYDIDWAPINQQNHQCIQGAAIGRLLSLFTDFYCFFAEDDGGLVGIARAFAELADDISNAGYPHFPPTAIIFVDCLAKDLPFVRHWFKELLTAQPFRRFQILSYSPPLSQARTRSLFAKLQNEAEQCRRERREAKMAFTAQQVEAYFSHACSFFASRNNGPFNFILWSRKDRPVAMMGKHITSLLNKQTRVEATTVAVPMIVAAILLDARVAGMHGICPLFRLTGLMVNLYLGGRIQFRYRV